MGKKIKRISFLLYITLTVCVAFVLLAYNGGQTQKTDFFQIVYRTPVYASGDFLSEPGTKDQPYIIDSKADMDALSLAVNSGNTFSGKYFVVDARIAELDLGNFVPIGNESRPFMGNFDGYGTNFKLNIIQTGSDGRPTYNCAGLFGYVTAGIIENLSVSGAIKGRSYVGGIVGYLNGGTVRNVYNTAEVFAESYAGGIVGFFKNGTLTNAYNRGEIKSNNSAGGIVGQSYQYRSIAYSDSSNTTLRYCYSSGKVAAKSNAGGIIGLLNTSRYSGYTENIREYIFYDVTVIAMYRPGSGWVKPDYEPSPLPVTASSQKLTSETFMGDMTHLLGGSFGYKSNSLTTGYYPQLRYFKEITLGSAAEQKNLFSEMSVAFDISNGLGTSNMPFKLRNANDLRDLSDRVTGADKTNFKGHHFKIVGTTKIELDNFIPIGNSSYKFLGSFDGSFAEFSVTINTGNYAGLFGYVGVGTIKNLYVSGTITGSQYVGAVVGYKESGTLINVYNKAEVIGSTNIGGIVGYHFDGVLRYAFNMGQITATSNNAGGIIGFLKNGVVEYTYNRGKISSYSASGGIVGQCYQYRSIAYSDSTNYTLRFCYSAALVQSRSNVGGVIGLLNTSRYSGYTENIRNNLFYDVSETAFYQPDSGYVKAPTAHEYGKTSEDLLLYAQSRLGFDGNWTFLPLGEENGKKYYYYPQLNVFVQNENTQADSRSSVRYLAGDGFGTATHPRLLRTKADFDHLSMMVASDDKNSGEGMYFEVEKGITEIDLGDFTPIGNENRPFKGTFNGNGVNLILNINKPTVSCVGLFGCIGSGAYIHNFSVSGQVIGQSHVGGIVGYMPQVNATVCNVYNTAKIVSGVNAGGIIGFFKNGTVKFAYNRGAIVSSSNAGGIVGQSYQYKSISYSESTNSTIQNCYSSGTVSAKSSAGGVIGLLNTSRYSGYTENIRQNIYYDITVIANYDLAGYIKPPCELSSSDPQRVDSGTMFTSMSGKFGSESGRYFVFKQPEGEYAFYPQLGVFADSSNQSVKERSLLSVRINVKDGMGTASLPFLLYDRDDLEDLKTRINNGNNFKGFYFKWAGPSKIELTDFTPIGTSSRKFYGSFDGNFAEFNVSINAGNYAGLFGYVGEGTIKNLYVSGTVSGGQYVGGIVGYKESGTLINVYNKAKVTGTSNVGGLVGYQYDGNLRHSFNMGEVIASQSNAGGIAGFLKNGVVEYTYNRGKITANDAAGGIVGQCYQYKSIAYSDSTNYTLRYCYSSALVQSKSNVGGVIGLLNTSRYSGYTENVRSSLYYDVSETAFYQPDSGYIKAPTAHAYGRTSEDLLLYAQSRLGFDNNWTYLPLSEEDGKKYYYYPQLNVFVQNENTQADSRSSVRYLAGDGFGTATHPRLLRTKEDFDHLSQMVAADAKNSGEGMFFEVEKGITEIDLGNFVPIGNESRPFKGTFNGNGVNLILNINRPTVTCVGLFGCLGSGAYVHNFSVSGQVIGKTYVGGIVGYMPDTNVTVCNVYNTAKIVGETNAGGIVGFLKNGTVKFAYNRGAIESLSNAGGVVGQAYQYKSIAYSDSSNSTLQNCYSSGTVSAKSSAGGVIGLLNTSRYSGYTENIRQNIYYDITVIANYDLAGYKKPPCELSSSDPQRVDSGTMFTSMSGKFGSESGRYFVFKQPEGEYAFYPQLGVFAESDNQTVKERSLTSVRVNVKDGVGTESMPFLLYDREDLEELKVKIKNGNNFKGFYFKWAGESNVELSNFTPIGNSSTKFYGSFDGSFAEFNVSINGGNYSGLFGYVGEGTIKNLSVSGYISGSQYVGAIIGYKESGLLINVYNKAEVNGTSNVGGLVGYHYNGNLQYCYNMGQVTASQNNAGGIIGFLKNGLVEYTYNRGKVIANDASGGIVGQCYLYRSISYSDSANYTLRYCYSSALVQAKSNVGGVIGLLNTSRYSGYTENTRSNLRYDKSVLEKFNPGSGWIKPSLTDSNALAKTEMFYDKLKNILGITQWEYRDTEGNFAYYPQLYVFANNSNERVRQDSLKSVTTNPFLGDGTEASPYIISSASDMVNLSKSISQEYSALGVYYRVAEGIAFINLSDPLLNFSGIGNESAPFRGNFNGNFADFRLQIIGKSGYQGLFGYISAEASVYNLSVSGNVVSDTVAGGVAGFSAGTIKNVFSTAVVSGGQYAGGVIGINQGVLSLAYCTGGVTSSYGSAGGVVGYNAASGKISDVYASAYVCAADIAGCFAGGVVGKNDAHLGASVLNAYYNLTLINYYNPPQKHKKPGFAIGNGQNEQTVRPLQREDMTKLQSFNFSSSNWKETAASGMWEYLVQLKSFAENSNNTIKQNSINSVRLIRFALGDGSIDNPYIIRNKEDMKVLSDVSKEHSLLGLYFKVAEGVETLNLTGSLGFSPIGTNSFPFKGHFDGNGASFVLDFNLSNLDYLGLFGRVETGEIKNLTVTGRIIGRNYIGGVAGYALRSTISNVINLAEVRGYQYVAGVVGYISDSSITNSYNNAPINGSYYYVGGLTGFANKGIISFCYNFGVITADRYAGGIAGNCEGGSNLSYIYNRNSVIGTNGYAGGITARLYSSIIDYSYSAAIIRAANNSGGLVGIMQGASAVDNSYYDQSIIEADAEGTGKKPYRAVGNLADQTRVCGMGKAYLTGRLLPGFSAEFWTSKENQGVDAYYLQLKVFADSAKSDIRLDSLRSVSSFIFAGLGSENSPYIIVNEYDLQIISDLSLEGNTFENTYFKVRETAYEFDLTILQDFKPIGSALTPFNGYLEGSGVNIKLGLEGGDYLGLFGYIGEKGKIYRISISGYITGENYVGSIAGFNKGYIDTVYSTAVINAKNYAGGIAGLNNGSINNMYFRGTIVGEDYVGGLVGKSEGIVFSGYVAANIAGENYVGGIIGFCSENSTPMYLYYDIELASIFKKPKGYLPQNHIGNLLNFAFVKGLTSTQMQSGQLNEMQFATPEVWLPKAGQSFEVYYPQLKYFGNHSNAVVKQNSLKSVATLRFKEGDGSLDDPFIVRTAEDMKAISDLVQSRNTLLGKYFKVAPEVKVIDLTTLSDPFKPIGGSYRFEGYFDGTFTRFVLNINNDANYQGLFGFIGTSGVVKNLSVEGYIRSGQSYAAGVAARNAGIVENVYNYANVNAYNYYAGGIVGYNEGIVKGAFNLGNINVERYDNAGGIVGYAALSSLTENAYNGGAVLARYYSGGIVGYAQGKVQNVYNFGVITCRSSNAGAVIGAVDANAEYKNGYYDTSILQTVESQYTKASKAISNKADREDLSGLTPSMLGGVYLEKVLFDEDIYIKKASQEFVVYYPQLKVFAENSMNNAEVKKDSLESVTKFVFSGKGTMEQPYLIVNEADMVALSIITSSGVSTEGKHFKVLKSGKTFDLTLPNLYYNPIGSQFNEFKGIFDGNYAIFKLNIETSSSYTGLFGNIGQDSVVKKLIVTGNISGGDYTGGVVGFSRGTLENVANRATVKGANYIGGVVGFNAESAVIRYSYNMGQISASANYTGGITGYNGINAEIFSCFNAGDIKLSYKYVGGITSVNEGKILSSYNTGDIFSQDTFVAGIAAKNYGQISEVYHSGIIVGGGYTAGVVALNNKNIEKAYYNRDSVTPRFVGHGYSPVLSAVYGIEDTSSVKGLALSEMTGLFAVGVNDDQMDFEYENYVMRAGKDFTTYFPELKYFKEHECNHFKDDSLQSITNKKIEGEGTEKDPFIIKDGFDMMTIGEFVLYGNLFAGKYFKVADEVAQIDLTIEELNYKPIGDAQYSFCGNFDGNNATFIIELYDENADFLGLFHTLGAGSSVKNLTIKGVILGRSYLGAVAGRNYGKILDVISEVDIKSLEVSDLNGFGGNSLGGITGVNGDKGTIQNCINRGKISGLGSYTAGISGENDGTIIDSFNKAAVEGQSHTGGISGINRGSIYGAYNTASITSNIIAGGIAGENCGLITECFNNGQVHTIGEMAGGIAGLMIVDSAKIYIVYHSGTVSTDKYEGTSSQLNKSVAGGIVGNMDKGSLYDAYVSGFVYGGNLLGMIVGQHFGGSITRSYYDIDVLKNNNHSKLNKPEKALGNVDKPDTNNYKSLLHGQMIGLNSIGTTGRQMNFDNKNRFVTTPSYDKFSFYPQIKRFADSSLAEVREDSLVSVRSITFITGDGSDLNPYILYNESDIIALAETVNSGNTYTGVHFRVSDTVSIFNFVDAPENYYFVAIGNDKYAFNGVFDGNSAIFRIKLNENADYQALFGNIGKNGEVFALSVEGSINGANYVAGIAGKNMGYIHEVYNRADIVGKNHTAGIAGFNGGLIKNVYNRGSVKGYDCVGGIVGEAEDIVEYSYNTGVIYGKSNVGALAGFLYSNFVKNSYYDFTILSAYADAGGYIKPTGAVGNNPLDSSDVFGLSKSEMTGTSAIGLHARMKLPTSIWTANRNTDGKGNNYPQLEVFSTSVDSDVKNASRESTLTTLYTITYNYNGATSNNTAPYAYVLPGYHYKLVIPFKFGYVLTGWYFAQENGAHVKYTDGQGNSLKPFENNSDITLEAHWEIAWHKVSFIDGYGKVVDSVLVRHGDTVEPSNVVPQKPKGLDKVYFFEEWDFDFTQPILEPTEIKAKYSEKDRYYYLAYYDLNGDFFALSDPIEYGTYAKPLTATPPHVADYEQQKAYIFGGWNFNFDEIIYESKSVYAIKKEVPLYYTVKFVDADGNIIGSPQIVEYGKAAIEPKDVLVREPDERYVYEFDGWDKSFSFVDCDMVVKALFKQTDRLYTVSFYVDDKIIAQRKVKYGESAIAPETPIKAAFGEYAYKFIGWNGDYSNITKDTDIFAEFEEIPRYYTVTYLDGDGNVFWVVPKPVEYLSSAPLPEGIPTKSPSERYVYVFDCWEQSYKSIQGDTFVKPIFNQFERKYTVRFLVDGELFGEAIQVVYGASVELPTAQPKKRPDYERQVGFKFIGWKDEQRRLNVTSDVDIEAEFEEITQKYIVKFYGAETSQIRYPDNLISSQLLLYGGKADVPNAPIPIDSREDYEWVFIGWDKPYEAFDYVTNDLEVFALYENRRIQYTVTVIMGDSIQKYNVFHGQDLVLPTPTKKGSDQITYEFVKWDCDDTFAVIEGSGLSYTLKSVKKNLTVVAEFNAIYNYYIVTFLDGNDRIIQVQYVPKGQDAKNPYPSILPTKDKTEKYVYEFMGWDRELTDIHSDLVIRALFYELDRYYTVTFLDAYGEVYQIFTDIEYGTASPKPLVPPKKSSDEYYSYEFTGWLPEFNCVKSNLVITPVYKKVERLYTVRFFDGKGKEIPNSMREATYGGSVLAPTNVDNYITSSDSRKIFVFNGSWIDSFTNKVWVGGTIRVTSDMQLFACFDEVDRYYTVRFFGYDLDGNTILLHIETDVEYGTDAPDPRRQLGFEVDPSDSNRIRVITGWQSSLSNIKENRDIYAVYDYIKRYYTVRLYQDKTFTQLLKEWTNVEYGSKIVPDIIPTMEADESQNIFYQFIGWSEDLSFIESDVNAYACFKEYKLKNLVTFLDGDGNIIWTVEVEFGCDAPDPYPDIVIPIKTPDFRYEYIFAGWMDSLANIREDRTIRPKFNQVDRHYIVEFRYQSETENIIIYSTTVLYAASVTPPEESKFNHLIPQDTQEYHYSYMWSRSLDRIEENTIIYLIIIKDKQNYKYTFFDYHGNIVRTDVVPYGTVVLPPAGPIREMTKELVYEFIGWHSEQVGDVTGPVEIKEETTFYPIYLTRTRMYTVTYLDGDGNVWDVKEVPYNGSVDRTTIKPNPPKTPTVQFYYVFDKWEYNAANVKNNIVIKPIYKQYLQLYEVIFLDYEDKIIGEPQYVKYGSGAIEPAAHLVRVMPPTQQYRYVFVGWDRQFYNITGNTVVRARYAQELQKYTYTFYNYDGSVLKRVTAEYGSKIIPPHNPTRPSDGLTEYVFSGWDKTVADVLTANVEYYAQFFPVLPKYKVIYYNGNGSVLFADLEVVYGTAAKRPTKAPTKDMSESKYYEFSGSWKYFNESTQEWIVVEDELDYVMQDLEVYPIFIEHIRTFIVTLRYSSSKVVKLERPYGYILVEGEDYERPDLPGYVFIGWSNESKLRPITQDIEVEALYKASTYTIYYYDSEDADSSMYIGKQTVTYGQNVILYQWQFGAEPGFRFDRWISREGIELEDNASFKYQKTGDLQLYAKFEPIIYFIEFDTDGGTQIEPKEYTVLNRIKAEELPIPTKPDYKFVNWEVADVKLTLDEKARMLLFRVFSDIEPESVDNQPESLEEFLNEVIGYVTLRARYVYDGYIQIKDEYKDKYFIAYADIVVGQTYNLIPVDKRQEGDSEQAYLIGVRLYQTLSELRDIIINERLEFLYEDGTPIAREDEDKVFVATGIRIVIRDETDPNKLKDDVKIILKGDINGDGIINTSDYNLLLYQINGSKPLSETALLLAALINDDNVINTSDYNLLLYHINGTKPLFD